MVSGTKFCERGLKEVLVCFHEAIGKPRNHLLLFDFPAAETMRVGSKYGIKYAPTQSIQIYNAG